MFQQHLYPYYFQDKSGYIDISMADPCSSGSYIGDCESDMDASSCSIDDMCSSAVCAEYLKTDPWTAISTAFRDEISVQCFGISITRHISRYPHCWYLESEHASVEHLLYVDSCSTFTNCHQHVWDLQSSQNINLYWRLQLLIDMLKCRSH